MDKFVHRKESTTPCILDRSHGLSEIEGFQVKNLRCQMRYRFGRVVNRIDRSILVMIVGLFLSISAFSQTTGGPAGPNSTSEQTIEFPAEQDKTPVDSQVRLKMDQILTAQVFHHSNIEDPRPAYFLNAKFAGPPESVFGVEDRKIPGPGGSIPVLLYTANTRTGLPPWVFFHGGGFVAGRLDTFAVPLRAVANRCDCPVVPAGYRLLAPENRYPDVPEDPYAATKRAAKNALEVDRNPKNPLLATPPGTFGLPPLPGSPQTPTSEANHVGGNIDLTTLVAHFRVGQRIRRLNR
jgi:hypothetical protein